MLPEEIHAAPGAPNHGAGLSDGIRAGGFLFISAIRGIDPATRQFSPDTKAQAHQAFKNLQLVLQGAGAGLEHVVKVTLYLHDLAYRTPFHEVWMEYFPQRPPARLAVQVADANVVPGRGAHFALDVIAVDPAAGR